MNKDLFYRKARELLDCEVGILEARKVCDDLLEDEIKVEMVTKLSSSKVQTKNLIEALVCLVIAAASVVLWILLGDGRYLTLLFGLLFILGLTVSYFSFLNLLRNKADYKSVSETGKEVGARSAEAKRGLASAMENRANLIRELNKMREEDESLAGRYWWDTGISPDSKLQLPGDVSLLDPSVSMNVRYELAHEVTVHERDNRLYCENIFTNGVAYTPDIVDTLYNSDKMAVLYHNDDVIRREKKGYCLLRLYAVVQNALDEIEADTKTVSHVEEKERRMQEYREKLDEYEIVYNGIFKKEGFYTNEEAALMGHRTTDEYLEESAYRLILERSKRDSINKQADYEEQTTYRRVFSNLYWNRYVTCAYVLMPIDPELDEQTAMILLPLEDLPTIEMTVRTASSDETYEGYLEEYRGQEALRVTLISRQCITLAVDNLLGEEVKAFLKIKPRNILEGKPKGLTDEEWVYLLWHGCS